MTIAAAPDQLATRRGLLTNPLHAAWLEAGRQAGYPLTEDMNGYQQEGFGRMDMTVGAGRRCSAANAYLRPALHRPNLDVRTHALATRILFEGRRAVGVRYRRDNLRHEVRARREVIVCGGPINSPQLLKLSGVGPGEELADLGINVVHDLEGVGENLQDHLEFYFQVASREPITLYSQMSAWRRALIGGRWLLTRGGLGSSNHFETGGFIRSRAGVPYPDIQFHFLPLAVSYDGSSLAREHGYQAHVGPMRSRSTGWVRLRSAEPLDKPKIFFNYMSREEDWAEMRACVRLTREIFGQHAFDRYRGREIQPGEAVTSDAQIDAFIRAKVESAYHPSCTCRMGNACGCARRGGSAGARDRPRGVARGGLLHHAGDHDRQSQRPDHHAGREGRRPHSRARAAAALERSVLHRLRLAECAALAGRASHGSG